MLADANAGRRTCGERRRSAGGHWDQRADVNRGGVGDFGEPTGLARGRAVFAAVPPWAARHGGTAADRGGSSMRSIEAINRSG
ncbi:hypothetical protein BOC60_06215 [Burkholderia pseudomallei]|nr:hypothetical protein BK015_16950 [Burkholderia pseudomallei]ARK39844.1 hypothetical protein BOC60_06215 [Burkholderia pseudomallei]